MKMLESFIPNVFTQFSTLPRYHHTCTNQSLLNSTNPIPALYPSHIAAGYTVACLSQNVEISPLRVELTTFCELVKHDLTAHKPLLKIQLWTTMSAVAVCQLTRISVNEQNIINVWQNTIDQHLSGTLEPDQTILDVR